MNNELMGEHENEYGTFEIGKGESDEYFDEFPDSPDDSEVIIHFDNGDLAKVFCFYMAQEGFMAFSVKTGVEIDGVDLNPARRCMKLTGGSTDHFGLEG